MNYDDPSLIHIHQIGGRSGNASWFPHLRAYREDYVIHSYDADSRCVAQVDETLVARGVLHQVHDFALSQQGGKIRLNHNYDPFTSSMYPLNPGFAHCRINHPMQGDYILGQTFATLEDNLVDSQTLQQIAHDGMNLDILEIDTQGSELDILRGGAERVRCQTLALFLEVSFVDAYQGQPLFDEVLSWALANDFRLIELIPHQEASWLRGPLEWRGRGALFFADALFLKDPRTIRRHHAHPWLGLKKLAFAALINGFTEYALECQRLARDVAAETSFDRKYLALLQALDQADAADAGLMYPDYRDVWSRDESLARFSADRKAEQIWEVDRSWIRKRYFAKTDKVDFRARIEKLISPEFTSQEQILANFDLLLSAQRLAAQRREQAMNLLQLLGLTEIHGNLDPIDWSKLDEE
ncbi:putative Methyltransferase FkbM domain-containing protein [Gammaproteobacteria bacterium]